MKPLSKWIVIVSVVLAFLFGTSMATMFALSDLKEELASTQAEIVQIEEFYSGQQDEIASMGNRIDDFITDQMNEPNFFIDLGSWTALVNRVDAIEQELSPPEDGEFVLREDFEYEGEPAYIELHYSITNGITTLDYLDGCAQVCETEQINEVFDEAVTGMTVEEWWAWWLESYFIIIDILN